MPDLLKKGEETWRRPRIFCVGLNKTGTRSLDVALRRLGFRSLHAGGTPSANQKILCAVTEGKPLLHYFDPKLDAFSDIEQLINRFDLADNQYPSSKFILTWRDLDSWLDSRTRHVERNIQKKQMGKYCGNWLTIDLPAWKQLWHTHYLRVEEYFRGRANHLLKINICAGDGYEMLCPFLNRENPREPFPWRHQTANLPDK